MNIAATVGAISFAYEYFLIIIVLIYPLQSPVERLGCHPETGFLDIQSHPFFRNIEWELLYNKQITPPYKPRVQAEMDLEHFDPQFTNEPVMLTPDDA